MAGGARAVALGAGRRRASPRHADVAGWAEARPRPVELAARDTDRRVRAVRYRCMDLRALDARARPPGRPALRRLRRCAGGDLPRERVRAAAAKRAGAGHHRAPRLALRGVGLLDRSPSRAASGVLTGSGTEQWRITSLQRRSAKRRSAAFASTTR